MLWPMLSASSDRAAIVTISVQARQSHVSSALAPFSRRDDTCPQKPFASTGSCPTNILPNIEHVAAGEIR